MRAMLWTVTLAAVAVCGAGCKSNQVEEAQPQAVAVAPGVVVVADDDLDVLVTPQDADPAVELPAVVRGLRGGIAVAAPESSALNRDAWPVVVVAPVTGVTLHRPAYFEDYRPDDADVEWATPEAAFDDVVQADTSETLGLANAADLVVQPAKFALDLVTLPVRAVLTPPWATVSTPPGWDR